MLTNGPPGCGDRVRGEKAYRRRTPSTPDASTVPSPLAASTALMLGASGNALPTHGLGSG